MNLEKKQTLPLAKKLFFGGLIVFAIFKLYYTTQIPLTGDEAYHWEWSRHLAWGYYDHPPLIAWLIAFFTAIGGHTLLWTRMTAVICLTGTIYLTYRLGREMGGEKVGIGAGLFSLTAFATVMGSILVSTDSPVIFFWQLTIYLVWRALKTGQGFYWYPAGIALGLGLLSKFLIMPLALGIFLFLVFSPQDRFWLRRKEPYLAFGLAILIFLPFLYWNSQNGWTSFVFHLTRHNPQVNLGRTLEYLGLGVLLMGPVLYGAMLCSFYRLIRRAITSDAERRISLLILFCGWLFPVFLFFDAIRNATSGHWPVPAYGVILAGLAWEIWNRNRERQKREGWILGPWILGLTLFWTVGLVTVTLNPDWLGGISVRKHTVNEGFGWEEIGKEVSRLHQETGPQNLIATSSYALSSMVSFYTPDHLYLSLLGPGSKHGRAYDIWDRWPEWEGRDCLFISEDDPNQETSRAVRILKNSFQRYQTLDPIEIKRKGKVVRIIYCSMGYGLLKNPYSEARQHYRW